MHKIYIATTTKQTNWIEKKKKKERKKMIISYVITWNLVINYYDNNKIENKIKARKIDR